MNCNLSNLYELSAYFHMCVYVYVYRITVNKLSAQVSYVSLQRKTNDPIIFNNKIRIMISTSIHF